MSPALSVPGAPSNPELDRTTLHLPRILCLHGGGANAAIFQAQARMLIRALPGFRLVFADAPYRSPPGTGIVPASCAILNGLEMCKRCDPGTGPWVGLLEFSQGAKVAASVLYRQQMNMKRMNDEDADCYRFAVLMAGRGPLVFLSTDPNAQCPTGLASAGQISTSNDPLTAKAPDVPLRLPTIHVHGLNDPGLYWHRDFLKRYHDASTEETVRRIAVEIYRVAREVGFMCDILGFNCLLPR
ncbi:hypothetical protein BDW67DRAFT_176305 [Aspergillus spinulosporus]